jgi:23S rRNA (adenine2503-C2)-methyltransferase
MNADAKKRQKREKGQLVSEAAGCTPSMLRRDIKNLEPKELEEILATLFQEKAYRARQILRWIYGAGAKAFQGMTNLPKDLREQLDSHFSLSSLQPEHVETSRDGTRKFVFPLADGLRIESVLIPERGHHTLCLSTQVGCALKCRFCLTGRYGLVRDLKPSEIVNQISAVAESLGPEKGSLNLVFMGMGEPLANYANTLKALRITTNPHGLKYSHRRVTLSTAGLIPELEQLGRDHPTNLAISLNASDDETRTFLMPINRKYPLHELLRACRAYPLPPRKRITFEYVLIKGVNDSPEDALRLARLLSPLRCKINLIPLNPCPEIPLERPREEDVEQFQEALRQRGVSAFIRQSRGADIRAACGQLCFDHRQVRKRTAELDPRRLQDSSAGRETRHRS